MERVFRHAQWVLARGCLALGVAAAVIGCHSACTGEKCSNCSHPNVHIDNCSDIPQGAIPQPVGTYMNQYLNLQAAKAEREDFVIYYSEWLDGQAVLGPYGSRHLRRIIDRMAFVPFPIIIQPEPGNATVTGLRHTAVIEALVDAGFRNAATRVIVTQSPAEGLFGEEAERIYPQLVRGGAGGFGGAGFSGIGFGGISGFGGGFGAFGGGIGFR